MTSIRPPPAFNWFVGVDWSGARGPRLPGLQVAVAQSGRSAPQLVLCPDGKHWTRAVFVAWFVETMQMRDRVLVGFDFAFSFPKADRGNFFPGIPDGPENANELWQRVECLCRDSEGFYAAPFVENGPYAAYFQGGDRYERRQRLTDRHCLDVGLGRPESIFRLVGSGAGRQGLPGWHACPSPPTSERCASISLAIRCGVSEENRRRRCGNVSRCFRSQVRCRPRQDPRRAVAEQRPPVFWICACCCRRVGWWRDRRQGGRSRCGRGLAARRQRWHGLESYGVARRPLLARRLDLRYFMILDIRFDPSERIAR